MPARDEVSGMKSLSRAELASLGLSFQPGSEEWCEDAQGCSDSPHSYLRRPQADPRPQQRTPELVALGATPLCSHRPCCGACKPLQGQSSQAGIPVDGATHLQSSPSPSSPLKAGAKSPMQPPVTPHPSLPGTPRWVPSPGRVANATWMALEEVPIPLQHGCSSLLGMLWSELLCQAAGFGMNVPLSYTSVPRTPSTSYSSFTPLQAWPLMGISCPVPNPARGSMLWGWHHPNLPPVPGRCHRTLSPIPTWPVSPWVPPRQGGGGFAGAVGAMCLSPGAARKDGMCCPKWHLN